MENALPVLQAAGSTVTDCLICVAGKNNIACDALRYLVSRFGPARVVVVPNADDLGAPTWQHSLRHTAQRLGVREVTLADVYPIENLLLLSLEFNELLRPARFATKRLFNIHFSHLPKYKGMYTSIWPILNDEAFSGVTLHYIDKGIDTGHLIAQRTFAIASADTSRDVYFKYLQAAYELLVENLDSLLMDTQQARPQPVTNSSYYSRATIDFSRPAEVDFRATAYQVRNYVRGFAFYEYQLPTALGHLIWRAELTSDPSQGKAGSLVTEDARTLTINTIDYNVRLHKDFSRALFAAVEANDLAEVRRLAPLTQDLNLTNRRGWSALMIACWHPFVEVARELLIHGANVNQTNLNGTSVLMYAKDGALRANDRTLLDDLLTRGADARWTDSTGLTVADYCRNQGQHELATYFAAAARTK